MVFPNFLGLGAMRCGTTWLNVQLASHPKIYLPERKEIHYFDQFYERGSEWYGKFFPPKKEAEYYSGLGEITPEYLFDPKVPERIKNFLPTCKFIVLLRNPVDRLFSHYVMATSLGWTNKPFWDFADEGKIAYRKGLYVDQLARYFGLFHRNQFLILFYEEIFGDSHNTDRALEGISNFLGIDSSLFPKEQIGSRVHERFGRPKFFAAYSAAVRLKRWLFMNDMDWVFETAKKLGVTKRIFGKQATLPKFSNEDRIQLVKKYNPSIDQLEDFLSKDLTIWRLPLAKNSD